MIFLRLSTLNKLKNRLISPSLLCAPYSSRNIQENTIFALCSGQGKCGVAVIRVSGAHANFAVTKMTRFKQVPQPRYAHLTSIRNPITREVLDKGLLFWYPGPNSFTGEDVCEFQVHGGLAIVSGILQSLETLENFRLARPGEFTKRAFYNKKMDLVEAEGLADLINAETELQRRQAFIQSQGMLSGIYKRWKTVIQDSLTQLESLFNFENIEHQETARILKDILNRIELLHGEVVKHLNDGKRGERLRMGVATVILGEPNVGKSSLYNYLCKRKAAIVTEHPGTTRDTLQTNLDIGGFPVVLYDTCGVRYDAINPVEAEGVKITLDTLNTADLIVLVIDIEKYDVWRRVTNKHLVDFIKDYVVNKLRVTDLIKEDGTDLNSLFKRRCIVLLNKSDKIPNLDNPGGLCISVKTKEGVEQFLETLSRSLRDICSEPSMESPAITKLRHRSLLEKSQKHLANFLSSVKQSENFEKLDYGLLCNDLRYSLKHIAEIIEGRKDNTPVVDVLDEIFQNFCIGK